ncbi:MAG: hypothetical protein KGZ63_08340 [Clostridiales bacterium]|jgi:hypothetical protein|nr:hypothetical protein [Clostridiales bacterium]
MEGRGEIPILLAYDYAEAKKLLGESQLSVCVTYTAAHEKPGHGNVRVVRQRQVADGSGLELTVSAEDWGKEV